MLFGTADLGVRGGGNLTFGQIEHRCGVMGGWSAGQNAAQVMLRSAFLVRKK